MIEYQELRQPIKAIVMAGGRGTRLHEVTGGRIPKDFVTIDRRGEVRGIDYTKAALAESGITDITYSANYYMDQYKDALGNRVKYHYQPEGHAHGNDLKEIIEENGLNHQYLILSTDCYFQFSDLQKMIAFHKPGSITRGGQRLNYSEMEGYRTMLVNDGSQAIVGDAKNRYGEQHTQDEGVSLWVNNPISLVDPRVYLETYKTLERLDRPFGQIDMYREVFGLLGEQNRRHIKRGLSSIMNVAKFNFATIDYGTPANLKLVRKMFPLQEGEI